VRSQEIRSRLFRKVSTRRIKFSPDSLEEIINKMIREDIEEKKE
jgi:ribosomal protein L19E